MVLFIILVAENSRKYETKEYVYKNKSWIDTVHNIMKNGYSAMISKDYIKLLEKNLHLKIDCPSNVACDVFNNIFKILYDKNINGLWTKLFFGVTTQKEYKQLYFKKVCVNKDAWNFALLMKLNRNKELLQKFKEILIDLKMYKLITIGEFNKIIKLHLEKPWLKDTYKVLEFFRNFHIVERSDANIYIVQNKIINDILKMIGTNVNKILFREYFYPAIGYNILNNNINL